MYKIKTRYNSGDGIVVVIVQDETGRKEQTFKVNQSDKETQKLIGSILKQKYGIDFTPYEEHEFKVKNGGFFDF